MPQTSDSPPRAPPIKYKAPLGTRWAKEKAAAGGSAAFDLPTDPVAVGPWILGECVGKGASGRVKIARHRHTGQLAAVKILPIAPLVSSRTSLATQKEKSDKQRLGIDREITMMKLMNHPNIMRIYDVYENDDELFLVLEYVEGGELFDFLVNRGRLPSTEALIYFRQIVYGLNYAHTFSIIHRDLKPENILIASLSPPSVKIADWGMAAFAPPAHHLDTSCGSPHYASPEIVNGEKYQGNATDIWSCGVILYALLTGRLPFDDKNVRTLLSKVKSGKYDMPSWIDPLAKDLLRKMLVVNVQDRITIPEILQHPWLTSEPSISFSTTDGKMHTLVPPPIPPSPTVLASPLLSPELIDEDLLASLKVIWGRHSDPTGDSIRRDLCSPSGQGTHTKAFYFLLGKYREETETLALQNAYQDVVMDDATSTASRPSTPADDLAPGLRKHRVADVHLMRSPISVTSQDTLTVDDTDSIPSLPRPVHVTLDPVPSTAIRKRAEADPNASRASSTQKTQVEQWKAQMQAAQRNGNVAGSARPRSALAITARSGVPRPLPRRGHTSVVLPERRYPDPPASAPVNAMGFSHHLQQLQARTPTPTTFAMSSPQRASMATLGDTTVQTDSSTPRFGTHGDILDRRSSALSTTSDDTLLETRIARRAMGSLTQKANDMATQASSQPVATQKNADSPGGAADSRIPRTSRHKARGDKENQSVDDGWNHVKYDTTNRAPVGLGVGGALGNRDDGNVTSSLSNPSKSRKEKDKKSRPPPLDLPSLNQKRSPFSMLGSPISLSSPIYPTSGGNRLMASPVVGEFKGWFSNLFAWKNSSTNGGLLYSTYDLQSTRANTTRVLEGLGVLVTNASIPADTQGATEHSAVLYCRIDQPTIDPSSGIPLKAVRFKLEIRSRSLNAGSQMPMSPIGEDNPYFVPAPHAAAGHSGSYPTTPINPTSAGGPNTANSMIPSSRPRSSLLPGARTSSYGTPAQSPVVSVSSRVDTALPPGCLCAIALVHEKGSTSSFKHVWKKLKDEYDDASGAYPCFSPAIPNTPLEGHRSVAI